MPEENPQQEEKKQKGGIIRTYEGDISDAVRFKIPIAGIAVAEQKGEKQMKKLAFQKRKKKIIFKNS